MQTVFDLITNPDEIRPAIGFYSIFLMAGLVLIAITAAEFRWRCKMRKFLLIFTPLWVGFSVVLMVLDARDTLQVQSLVLQGKM